MQSIYIKDFRFGLDARKSELTQRPGTLLQLLNGQVNQGGEIENRRAFVRTAGIADTFGLQQTSSGLYTFGSKDLAGSFPLNIGTVGTPIYVNYQRLEHPSTLDGMASNTYDMSAVVFSENFAGKAFVVATFGAQGTYAYYDGEVIEDFTAGVILTYLAGRNDRIGQHLKRIINETADYDATTVTVATATRARASNVATLTTGSAHGLSTGQRVTITGVGGTGYNDTEVVITVTGASSFTYANTGSDEGSTADTGGTVSILHSLDIVGPAGIDYVLGMDKSSTSGTITGPTKITDAVVPVDGVSATGSFRIMAGSESASSATAATGSVTHDTNNPAVNDTVTIGGKVYRFVSSLTDEGDVKIGAAAVNTLTNLKSAINHAGTPGSDYLCARAHPWVTAGTITTNTLPLTALAGSSGNSVDLAVSTSGGTVWTVSGALMTGGAGNCVASVKIVAPDETYTELLGSAVDFDTDNVTTAAAVATEINSNTASGLSHGYSADTDEERVIIYAPDDASPVPNNYVVQVGAGGDVCIGACMFYFVPLASSFSISSILANNLVLNPSQIDSTAYPDLTAMYYGIAGIVNASSGQYGIVMHAEPGFVQVSKLVTRSDDPVLPLYVDPLDSTKVGVVFGTPPANPVPLTVEVPGQVFDFVDVPNKSQLGYPLFTYDFHYQPPLVGTTVVTAIPSGGSGTYVSFLWRPLTTDGHKFFTPASGDALQYGYVELQIDPSASGGQSTLFTIKGIDSTNSIWSVRLPSTVLSCKYVCEVTDSLGVKGVSNPVTIGFTLG